MLDIIVDSEIIGIRERAKGGNFNSMIALVSYMLRGIQTPKDVARAEQILDHVLAHEDQLDRDAYWDALCLKSEILEDDILLDQNALLMIRDMVQAPLHRWDFPKFFSALRRLEMAVKENPEAVE